MADCEEVLTATTKEIIKSDGFQRVQLRDGSSKIDSYGTLHVKMFLECFERRSNFAEKRT